MTVLPILEAREGCILCQKRFLRQGSAAQAHRRLQSFAAEWLHLSARWCSRTFLASRAGVDWSALSRVHQEGWLAAKLARPQPTWLPCLGCNAWEVQGVHAQADQQGWTEDSAGGDLGRPAARCAQPGCAGVPEEATGVHSCRRWPLWVCPQVDDNTNNRPFSGPPIDSKRNDVAACLLSLVNSIFGKF